MQLLATPLPGVTDSSYMPITQSPPISLSFTSCYKKFFPMNCMIKTVREKMLTHCLTRHWAEILCKKGRKQ